MTKYNCANYHVKSTFLTGFIQGAHYVPPPPPPPRSTGRKKKPVVGRVKKSLDRGVNHSKKSRTHFQKSQKSHKKSQKVTEK